MSAHCTVTFPSAILNYCFGSPTRNRWFNYDDSVVTDRSIRAVARSSSQNGYLYFYTHRACLLDNDDSN